MYKLTCAVKCPKAHGYYQHPHDCQKFIFCVEQKVLYEYTCGQNTYFNNVTKVCDWKKKVSCNQNNNNFTTNQISVTSSSSASTTITPSTMPSSSTKESLSTTKVETILNSNLTTTNPEVWTWTTTINEWHPSFGSTTTAEPNPPEEFVDNYKIVCYFTNWAWYRPGDGKFIPEDVNAKYCTHINYAFAVLDSSSSNVRVHDMWADIDNQFLRRAVRLKKYNSKLKVLLALGGWNDSAGDKYSKLVNNPENRKKFITNILEFLLKYKFDGLDLDWEYPKCWQTNCKKGLDSDREAFGKFVEEIRSEFKKRKLLLTAAVSPSKLIIDEGYDVKTLAKNLDFINLMAYDYHGSWENFASHHSPIYKRQKSEDFDSNDHEFNANSSVHHWINKGMPAEKIVLGVPFYGRSFELEKNADEFKSFGFGEKTRNAGNPGPYTHEKGYLAYYEICDNIKQKSWKKHLDAHSNLTFATYKNQWVGYDDSNAMKEKAEFIKEHHLGGAMVWAIDLDDFRGKCCNVKYPLLKTLNHKLRGIESFRNIHCY